MASIKAVTGQAWNESSAIRIKPSENTGSAYDFNIYLLNKVNDLVPIILIDIGLY